MKRILIVLLSVLCLTGCSPHQHREYTEQEKQALNRQHAMRCRNHGNRYIIELLEKIDKKLPDREGVQ